MRVPPPLPVSSSPVSIAAFLPRLAQLEQQLRDTEAALEKIMAERRAEQDSSFFLTESSQEGAVEPGGKSEEVLILEERVASLEAQLRTHEKLSETHIETYLAVDRMRNEKVDMDEAISHPLPPLPP